MAVWISLEDFTYIEPKLAAKIYDKELDFHIYVLSDASVLCFEGCSFLYKTINGQRHYFNESFDYPEHINCCAWDKNLSHEDDTIELEKCCSLLQSWTNNYRHFTFNALPKLAAPEKQGFIGLI